jgi:hypothetical protein
MDFSKLTQNEKMSLYGAAAVVIAGSVSNWGGLLWLSILAGLVAIVVILLPLFSPSTALPGSRGSILLVLGAGAALFAVIELLRYVGYTLGTLDSLGTIAFLISLVASLVMAWFGLQESQAEGGKFQLGSSGAAATTAPPSVGPPSASAAPPPPAASTAPAPSGAPPPAAPPSGLPEEPRRDDSTPSG